MPISGFRRSRLSTFIWDNKNWKVIFHIVDAQGPELLGLKTLRQPHSSSTLQSTWRLLIFGQEIIRGEGCSKPAGVMGSCSWVLKFGDVCSTLVKDSQVQTSNSLRSA